MKRNLEKRYEELDDMMKMYFRERTLIEAWDFAAEKRNRLNSEYNKNKHWWQKKRPTDFPSYHATPVRLPSYFPIPPTFHPHYEKTKKLIEEYLEGMS